MSVFDKYEAVLNHSETVKIVGEVEGVTGIIIEVSGLYASVGDVCEIHLSSGRVKAEVVGIKGTKTYLMPLGSTTGLARGVKVVNLGKPLEVPVGSGLLGRVIDGTGEPIDGKGVILAEDYYPVDADPPSALERKRITEPLHTGIRAIDGVLTVGKGQRMGIFSGSGVGKSTLLSMIARNTSAEVSVIALIGERGREVREFIERDLGEEGLKRSVVVAVTSDSPPMMRIRGAYVATAVAEYFRDQGADVILLMDSITRFAYALREVGLAVGEPPSTRGYPPSVFATLPRLLERAGTSDKGTITAFYTVLVEGDDVNEPVSDHTRGIIDGHIVLSRELASRAHYPAIDVLMSVSRLMPDVVDEEHLNLAMKLRETLAVYRNAEDLINIGAYVKGSNPKIDFAISVIDKIENFLKQGVYEKAPWEETIERLRKIFQQTD